MIDITGILTIAFIRICLAQLNELEKRYQHKAWIKIIVDYARGELRIVTSRIHYGAYASEGKNIVLNDEQMYALVKVEKTETLTTRRRNRDLNASVN